MTCPRDNNKLEGERTRRLVNDEFRENLLAQATPEATLVFLQEQVFQRVGGREDIRVNARIVAATNTDIETAIAQGKFREDLYYRLGVVVTQLPPLKERGDDILLLANLFLRRYAAEFKRKVRCFSVEALSLMQNYDWPGNVREL